jgi:protein-tyrosine phosphatase
LNWIIKDKILAFAGPSFERHVSPEGYCTLAPSDYIPYFQKKNVDLVVRLNKKNYHESDFVQAGIKHVEAFFLDGSCPPAKILRQVLDAFEAVPQGKAFAVHCKAGLGRTGTCIGAYMMKHYRFTAEEVIGYMRVCRPGMVIGPQQHYLKQIEGRMWQEGEVLRPIPRPRGRVSSTPDGNENAASGAGNTHAHNGHAPTMGQRVIGQAERLLAARGRRRKQELLHSTNNSNNHNSASELNATPHLLVSPPATPETSDRGKAPVLVTPDSKSRLLY